MIICIAICTRERPNLLAKALHSLNNLHMHPDIGIHVLVVENNAEETCKRVLKDAGLTVSTTYVLEPELGLVPARNRAFEEADKLGADWLAFMDDDELMDAEWPLAIGRAIEKFAPDTRVFFGASWAIRTDKASDFAPYTRVGWPYGTVVNTAHTNNVVVHRSIFALSGDAQRFDPAFRFSGSEDIEFFKRQNRRDVTIRWIPDAITYEKINPDRLSIKYRLGRIRGFQSDAVRIRKTYMSPAKAALTDLLRFNRTAFRMLAFIIAGLIVLPFDAPYGKQTIGRGMEYFARLKGLLDGYRGRVSDAYQKVIGD